MSSAAVDWRDRVLRAKAPRRYFVAGDRVIHVVVALATVLGLLAYVVWDRYVDPCASVRRGDVTTTYERQPDGRMVKTEAQLFVPGCPAPPLRYPPPAAG